MLKNRGVQVGTLDKDHRTTYFTFYDLDHNKWEVCHWI